MKISFKTKTKKEKPYDPEFVKMVLEASKKNDTILFDEDYKKKLFGEL
jgi:hypothetical protein